MFNKLILILSLFAVSCNAQNDAKENKINMKFISNIHAPEFPKNMEWLNIDKPLTIKELKGKIVLIDFWTYCCINCIHIIPDLKRLEAEFPDELLVIGVHSAKFNNEKDAENISSAIRRYEIEHPVVNDNNFEIWSEYAARAWPTFVLINPRGQIVLAQSGEGVYDRTRDLIAGMIKEFDKIGEIDRRKIPLNLEKNKVKSRVLSFPSKIIADNKRNILYISDSNNNRIISIDEYGNIIEVIGSGTEGNKDGNFEECQFNHPHGMALDENNNILYIADTENHLIRKIDINNRKVERIAGLGVQANWGAIGGDALRNPLNSPWDLALVEDTLFIAMAGNHQIWYYTIKSKKTGVYAGNGYENIIDGNLKNSSFAQPSGVVHANNSLYIADSEVSGIRHINRDNGKVSSLVGEGLFEFGDIDGYYPTSRLQHAIGLTFNNGKIYIADTYNHKIKILDPDTKKISTFIGSGTKGNKDGNKNDAQLNEPNGLVWLNGILYICDTNNDLIKKYNPKDNSISSLEIKNINKIRFSNEVPLKEIDFGKVALKSGGLELNIKLNEKEKINPDAPYLISFKIVYPHYKEQIFSSNDFKANYNIVSEKLVAGTKIEIDIYYYYCDESNACFYNDLRLKAVVDDNGHDAINIKN